jgi:hypothetical protein
MTTRFGGALVVLAAIAVGVYAQQVDWIAGVRNKPSLDVRQYNFAPQRPGGSLSAGNNTITMKPVPLGLSGSDSNHRVWVSGGSGTAEACLINGGSGTAGSQNGSIQINCANTHSGAWTVAPVNGGIQEAAQAAATAGGGTVMVPAGTISVLAAVQLPSLVSLVGAAEAQTILQIANGALAANAAWQVPGVAGTYCVVCLASGSSFVRVRDLTIDANGTNQTWIYYGDITGYNATNAIIERVTVRNHINVGGTGVTHQFLGHSPLGSNTNNVIINSSSIGLSACTVPNGHGAYYIEGTGNRIISSYALNFCDSPYVISECDHCSVVNSVADVGGGQMATPTYSIEGATNSTFENDQCIGTGANGHRYCVGIASLGGGAPVISSGNKVINVSGSHISTILEIGNNNSAFSSADPIFDTDVIGIHADGAGLDCIVLSEYVNKVNIIGGELEACGNSGISIGSTGSTKVVSNVYIDALRINHAASYGILAVNGTTGPPVTGIKIVNSFIGDDNAVPRQQRGIWFQAGTVADAYIVGNTITGNTLSPTFFQNGWGSGSQIGPNITGTGESQQVYVGIGANVASAAVITPSGPIFHVTGTTTIQGMNPAGPPATGTGTSYCVTLISDSGFALATGGNIKANSTITAGKTVALCYDSATSFWYASN